jgi:hypothetical protein
VNPIPTHLNIIVGTNPPTPIPNNKTKLHKSFASIRFVGSKKMKKNEHFIHENMANFFKIANCCWSPSIISMLLMWY